LYTNALPEDEDCGEGLGVGEIARVVDRFQAVALYERSVQYRKTERERERRQTSRQTGTHTCQNHH